MKKFLLYIIPILLLFTSFGIAGNTNPWLEIIPKWDNVWSTVREINSWWHVRDIYKEKATSNMSLWDQFASGIMTRDTLLDYAAYLMKFIWQLALLAGAVMFIIYWYKKAIASWQATSKTLVHVILWILVVIFSYVIIRTVRYAFIA